MIENSNYVTIPDFEDYEITEFGQIRRKPKKHISSKGIKPYLTSKGYYTIGLQVNGKYKTKGIHNLVAKTFLDNPNKYTEVNHKDGNKLNNHVSNLEWCTKSYNTLYNVFLGRNPQGEKVGTSKLKIQEVKEIYECSKSGIPSSIISRKYKICRITIHSITSGKWWKILNLSPIKSKPIHVSYESILKVEELLEKKLTNKEIASQLKMCNKTINNIKNKKYESFKINYRKFILNGV
jgi:hypothetical protein